MITEQMLQDAINKTKDKISSKEDELVKNINSKYREGGRGQDLDEIDVLYRLQNKLKGMMKERFGVIV